MVLPYAAFDLKIHFDYLKPPQASQRKGQGKAAPWLAFLVISRKFRTGETMAHTLFQVVADSLAEVTSQILENHSEFTERVICARACDYLQRMGFPGEVDRIENCRRLFVVSEYPFGDGSAKDLRVDLRIVHPNEQGETTLWMEVKPFREDSNYYNYGKFFTKPFPAPGNQASNRSIILDDIDKVKRLRGNNDAIAFALVFKLPQDLGLPDPTPAQFGSRLSAQQVYWLAKERSKQEFGKDGIIIRSSKGAAKVVIFGLPAKPISIDYLKA